MNSLVAATAQLASPIGQAILAITGEPHATQAAGGEPSWIVALLLGAVVGTIVDKYGGVVFYPLRLARPDYLLGEWWEYHFSYLNNEKVIREAKFTVSRGITANTRRVTFRHIAAVGSGGQGNDLEYRGTLRIEAGQLLIELDATTHTERLVYRFVSPIPTKSTLIPGIWMSFDHDSHPAAGGAVLSKQKMTEDDAKREILRHASAASIRVK